MGEFVNSCRVFANKSCDILSWKPLFLEYDPALWDEEGGGLFQYFEDDKLYMLSIAHVKHNAFVLVHDFQNRPTLKNIWNKWVVSDPDLLGEFIDIDDFYYPVGCFLPVQQAWFGVEDFLLNPTVPSNRLEWIDGDKIPFPER